MEKDQLNEISIQILKRIKDTYPFESITLGPIPYGSTPKIRDGASLHLAYKPGGLVTIAQNAIIRQGHTRLTCDGKNSFVSVGARTILDESRIAINGDNCAIIIGPNCRLKNLRIKVANDHSIVVIGAKTSWESGAVICESGDVVALGDDCMVSNDVIVRTSDGHSIFDARTRVPLNAPADTCIGHHVWLGNGSRVNKGTQIGSGAVIGQKSVVSGKCRGGAIHAGMPAKMLREDIVWSRTSSFEDIPDAYRFNSEDDAHPPIEGDAS